MGYRHILLALLWIIILPLAAQKIALEKTGKLPKSLKEVSGMCLLPNGYLVHINDGGNPACLIFTDTSGAVMDVKCPDFLANKDWEDIAFGGGYLFIGDFGNNNNQRKNLKIYRLEISDDFELSYAGQINFSYATQRQFPPKSSRKVYDLEAMVYFKDTLHLFSKNRSKPFDGKCYHYKLPSFPGSYGISPVDSMIMGTKGMQLSAVTGASISPSGNRLALLGYNQLWLINNYKNSRFFNAEVERLEFKFLSQKEGIAFLNDSTLLISDENHPALPGGKLYQLKLPPLAAREFTPKPKLKVKTGSKFQEEIIVSISECMDLPILWEMFNVNGERVHFGKITEPSPSHSHELAINTTNLPPGGYVLSIIIADTPSAFKLKKLIIK